MSGGSWGYAYQSVEDLACKLSGEPDTRRKALGAALYDIAKVMRAIEWHDSADTVQDDEDKAWAAFEKSHPGFRVEVLQQAIRSAERTMDDLRSAIECAKEGGQ